MFKKLARMHQQKAKGGKRIEKFSLIFDPEDPDLSLGRADENEGLFAVELSQIDVN